MEYNKIFRKHNINLKLADSKEFSSFFREGVYDKMVFNNDLNLDRETFVKMHLVNSYAPCIEKERERHGALVDDFIALFDEFSADGSLLLPTLTHAFIGCV